MKLSVTFFVLALICAVSAVIPPRFAQLRAETQVGTDVTCELGKTMPTLKNWKDATPTGLHLGIEKNNQGKKEIVAKGRTGSKHYEEWLKPMDAALTAFHAATDIQGKFEAAFKMSELGENFSNKFDASTGPQSSSKSGAFYTMMVCAEKYMVALLEGKHTIDASDAFAVRMTKWKANMKAVHDAQTLLLSDRAEGRQYMLTANDDHKDFWQSIGGKSYIVDASDNHFMTKNDLSTLPGAKTESYWYVGHAYFGGSTKGLSMPFARYTWIVTADQLIGKTKLKAGGQAFLLACNSAGKSAVPFAKKFLCDAGYSHMVGNVDQLDPYDGMCFFNAWFKHAKVQGNDFLKTWTAAKPDFLKCTGKKKKRKKDASVSMAVFYKKGSTAPLDYGSQKAYHVIDCSA